jgi:RNA polymerase sigma factor (sigma-70 family)
MSSQLRTILGHLQRRASREQTGALTDLELLRRYLTKRDEAAFEALVWRHGAMVLAVCRRLARHEQDAEDAFQAVFLAFARTAGSIGHGESAGGWLYRVACRVARKARFRAARHPVAPLGEVAGPSGDPAGEAVRSELGASLDAEVCRLPAKCRTPFVLCYLQGRTHRQAASELGWPVGTVATRVAQARRLLRGRLARHGLALSAATLAGLAEAALPRVPFLLDTIRVSLSFAGGAAVTDLVPAPVGALTQGVLRIMTWTNRRVWAAVLIALGLAATAAASQILAIRPDVRAVSRTGGAPTQEVAHAAKPAGGRLLFYRQGHLTLIGPDGKNAKRVSEDRGRFMPGTARLSPDGKRIAFLVQAEENPPREPDRDPRRKVYVRTMGEPEPGTDLGVEGQCVCWSPDGKSLVVTDFVYGHEPKDVKTVTWVVEVKTRAKTATKVPDSHIVTDWSRDGKYFLATEIDVQRKTSQLHLVRRDGSGDQELTAAGKGAFIGRLSPDGRKVLYMAPDPERKGKEKEEQSGLFVLDVRGGNATRVQGQPLNGSAMGFCWSSDGKRIAHTWRLDQGPPSDGGMFESFLVVSNPDGSNPITIATERGDSSGLITLGDPDWR